MGVCPVNGAKAVAAVSGRSEICMGAANPAEVVPEPITLVVLGTGLAGVAAARRRRTARGA